MRNAAVRLVGAAVAFALMAGPAQAAKTYNDPWLEGDLQQMRVPAALDILARTPAQVIVGDVDSGARLSDPDLAPHLLSMPKPYRCASAYGPGPDYGADPADGDFGCDFIGSGSEGSTTTDPDGDPTDPYGHGTGTAEIIAGVPNNGIEGAGVAPNARVLPVRACYGGQPDCYDEPALDGVEYAIAMGATIINASWPPGDVDGDTAFLNVIQTNPKVLFDFAIGGSDQNSDPYTPVCTDRTTYPNVICVGLANADDSAGTVNADKTTDVSAPGNAGVPSASGARAEFSYTSGATAHLSGAAAVLRGLAPSMTPSAIRQVLVATSRQVTGYATANRAHGIVDLEAAVRSVQQTAGLTTPAVGHGAPADATDPFPGQTVSDSGGPGASTPTPTATPTPAVTPFSAPVTVTPQAPSPVSAPAPAPAPAPSPTPAHETLSLSVTKLASSVRAGTTLTLHLRVTGGTASVTATLAHGKKRVARTTKRNATGSTTLTLHVPRTAATGKSTLTVTAGAAKALVRTITVAHHR